MLIVDYLLLGETALECVQPVTHDRSSKWLALSSRPMDVDSSQASTRPLIIKWRIVGLRKIFFIFWENRPGFFVMEHQLYFSGESDGQAPTTMEIQAAR